MTTVPANAPAFPARMLNARNLLRGEGEHRFKGRSTSSGDKIIHTQFRVLDKM